MSLGKNFAIKEGHSIQFRAEFYNLANMVMFSQNRAAQAEVSGRAQYVQQAAQLEPLYREMVKALGELTVRNNDVQLRDMLAKQGITVSVNPAAPAAPGPPAAEPKKGGK